MGSNVFENANFYVRAGQLGPFNDDFPFQVRGDNYGALVTQDLNGKYAEATRRGDMFICSTTTAAALLLSATTGLHPTIWNPQGSGVVVYPVCIRLSFVSGTTVIGSVVFGLTEGAGSAVATGAKIVTFTDVAPRNALLGAGRAAKFYFAPAVCTFTTAPPVIAAAGINLGAVAPTNGGGPIAQDLDGMMGIYPGSALSIMYSVTTSTSVWFTSVWCVERPLVAGM